MRFVRGFGKFWYDLIVGDDWKIAVAVVLVLLAGTVLVLNGFGATMWLPPLLGAGLVVAFTVTMLIDVRNS